MANTVNLFCRIEPYVVTSSEWRLSGRAYRKTSHPYYALFLFSCHPLLSLTLFSLYSSSLSYPCGSSSSILFLTVPNSTIPHKPTITHTHSFHWLHYPQRVIAFRIPSLA